MIADTGTRLIAPHGGELVDRSGDRPAKVDSLEVLTLTSRELSDLAGLPDTLDELVRA